MTHRYGRHGTKAWLRWRNRHFSRTSLMFSPQVAILNVPLEFLSKIRKVTIIMADGSQVDVEANTQQETDTEQLLASPIVDADEERYSLPEPSKSPKEIYLHEASEVAGDLARYDFKIKVNPYKAKPDIKAARVRAESTYSGFVGSNMHKELGASRLDAYDSFVEEVKRTYPEKIHQLSVAMGVDSDELKQLLVAAREDKSTPKEYRTDRAVIRAYISLLPNVPVDQESVEEILPRVRARAELYQKFYEEFEPKEED